MYYKAALFDLDGVVLDTESQYSFFWESQFQLYFPKTVGLSLKIKGQTLSQIYKKYFADLKDEQPIITKRLDNFEQSMSFKYIEGFEDFVRDLKQNGIKTAIVTSSNHPKMMNVYKYHPEFKQMFDIILTSEDFSKSKPAPDCYLAGARRLGLLSTECIGFEDSFNGLLSVRAADMFVVGLSTTNTADSIRQFSDVIINNYNGLDYKKMCELITSFH